MRHKTLNYFFCSVLIAVTVGCTSVKQEPAYEATFVLDAKRYTELLTSLDVALKPFGLVRVGAAPGLNELTGRDVLFAAYMKPGSKLGALSVTDVKKKGTVDVRVYTELFTDTSSQEKFLGALRGVIEKFGGKIEPSEKSNAA